MKRIGLALFIWGTISFTQTMIVRVYGQWADLARISPKYALDIAGASANQWYDIVADRKTMDKIIASGLTYEVRIYSLELEKEKARGQYYTYDQYVTMIRQMAQNYPAICKFDSLPIRTYENRWIYGVKISDNPGYEDPTEPGFLIDGCHHAREWATPFVVYKFCDSITKVYNSNNEIKQIVDNVELYCFPVINADGYVYDYPAGNMWRKDREIFAADTGTDPNRNYGGCSGDIAGDWGAVDENQATHYPDYETFCGAYVNSGDETRALTMYVKSHIINAYMSYHSYSELLLWPWGWTGSGTPDATVYTRLGNRMAGMINCLYGGTYTPGQSYSNPYPTSGGSDDWLYSWCHWVGGIANLSYVTEIGTDFYQNTSQLDAIFRENFKALKYLAQLCRDSIGLLCEGCVAPPQIYPIGTVSQNFTIYWHPVNPTENHPTQWELVELSNPSIIEDNLESGTGRWVLQGFTLSTTYSHSATHSFFSGNTNNMNSAVRTIHPYLVQSGDSFTFWCRYQLETNYDVAVVEISENGKEWFNLDTTRFTGNQTSWVRKAYSLNNWIGKSVYFRFRSMTDGNTLNGGFYVDDIRPVCLYNSVTTISSNITDTTYTFTNHPIGEYYYYVRGYNTTWGWGEYSMLQKASVGVGVAEDCKKIGNATQPQLYAKPNPFSKDIAIGYEISDNQLLASSKKSIKSLKIYNGAGRLVRDFSNLLKSDSHRKFIWDGNDNLGNRLPSGVYFIYLTDGEFRIMEKILKLP
uniref:carboxypeptidase T n=1 Tax=candidate division WOR-3 bacterium TaxID=2052148 RepID=A0A7C4TH87_UNCW3